MGWYKTARKHLSTYESKIVKLDAERIARRQLYFKGDTSPSQEKIDSIVSNVVDKLEKKYGSLDLIRKSSPNETLNKAIELAVKEELP